VRRQVRCSLKDVSAALFFSSEFAHLRADLFHAISRNFGVRLNRLIA
jgi:hypothetical protein